MLEVLRSMIQFNPLKRPSARDLLSSKVFDPVRKPEQEIDAPWAIRLPLYESGTFNYETLTDSRYAAKDLNQMLLEEIRLVK